jgi:hypothetical protein
MSGVAIMKEQNGSSVALGGVLKIGKEQHMIPYVANEPHFACIHLS